MTFLVVLCNDTLSFRRHYIIVFDVSTPFLQGFRSTPDYQKIIKKLFTNNIINSDLYYEANTNNIAQERQNNINFFEENLDEISFFHFGIAQQVFSSLRWTASFENKKLIQQFIKSFIKDKNKYWSDYNFNNLGIDKYLSDIFYVEPYPPKFGDGVTLSNFVYPLIIDGIANGDYAKEYILIIMSDFLTGSEFGNRKDFERIKEVFGYNDKNSPEIIRNYISKIESKFYLLDYFEFGITPIKHPQKSSGTKLGIIAYKIKPKASYLDNENLSIFVDADLNIYQKKYQGTKFNISDTKIKFTHGNDLLLAKLSLLIDLVRDSKPIEIFNENIAYISDSKWYSKYTKERDFLDFDKKYLSYYLPRFKKVEFDSSIIKKKFNFLLFNYKFYTNYQYKQSNNVNYIFSTIRTVNKSNIHYKSKTSKILMIYIIPILIVFLIIIILVFIGKPISLNYDYTGFLDNYKIIDYTNKIGIKQTPYQCFSSKDREFIIVNCKLSYKYKDSWLNWKAKIKVKIIKESLPEGFKVFVVHNTDDRKQFYLGNELVIPNIKNDSFYFFIGFIKTDPLLTIDKIENCFVSIKLSVREKRLFIIRDKVKTEIIPYEFNIGPDLGKVWVGFDPGTTGSCIAVAREGDKIIMEPNPQKKEKTEKIMPSVLSFDTSQNIIEQEDSRIDEDLYRYGNLAIQRPDSDRKFQSIKKLLGFKTKKNVQFVNTTKDFTGQQLTSLLIYGMYNDLKQYISKHIENDFKELQDKNARFNPKRAVVTIPNNFTISKIQDVINAFKYIKDKNGNNQFNEVRYIYESEAILFYLISKTLKESENYRGNNLVFDMGGATINASLLNVDFYTKAKKYEIDILGKMGYGIGGDTIDYALLKFIFQYADDYPNLSGINNPFINPDIRRKYQEFAFDIKKKIIKNFNEGAESLIKPSEINDAFLTIADINIRPSDKLYKNFLKNTSNTYPILESDLFNDLIYNNVSEIVCELINLSHVNDVSNVIFAGRSTSFPKIKETVKQELKKLEIVASFPSLGLDESKIAVAKGAALYGVNKSGIQLNNVKTNGTFGVKHKRSLAEDDIDFIRLIEMGQEFTENSSGDNLKNIFSEVNFADTFTFTNQDVNFYQIMGENAKNILLNNEKHKINKIATIHTNQKTDKLSLDVCENDKIESKIITETNRPIPSFGEVPDQEIADANDEHYTWIVQ